MCQMNGGNNSIIDSENANIEGSIHFFDYSFEIVFSENGFDVLQYVPCYFITQLWFFFFF